MATFLMCGKYTADALAGASPARSGQVVDAIEKCGGTVNAMYATLGQSDLVFVLDFPTTKDAMKASVAITRLTGIGFSTVPAVTVEEFDKLSGEG